MQQTVDRKPSLRDVLHDLKKSFTHLHSHLDGSPLDSDGFEFKALKEAIVMLGTPRPAKRVLCPAEYLTIWRSFISGNISQLDNKTLRFLCYEPSAALDEKFLLHLTDSNIEISARSLLGLVRSYHAGWTDRLAMSESGKLIEKIFLSYNGSNRLVKKWQQSCDIIIGAAAPQRLSQRIMDAKLPTKEFCQIWDLDEDTPFMSAVVTKTVERCLDEVKTSPESADIIFDKLLSWPHWSLENLKQAIGNILMNDAIGSRNEWREKIKAFVFRKPLVAGIPRFGDPRLPGNKNDWVGVNPEATRRLQGWLSQEDITFFFEHVLPDKVDRHDRKPFWLQYVSQIKLSRPFLIPADKVRLDSRLKSKTENYGNLRGSASAFLLDFGNLLVVEFSTVGCCYIYDRDTKDKIISMENFWSLTPIMDSSFKKPDLCITQDAGYVAGMHYRREKRGGIVHREGWQDNVRKALARHGIRPD